MIFCLFVWSSPSHSWTFLSFEDVTIVDKGLQILINDRYLWALTSESSLACHTYCDKAHPFIMVISEDLCHTPNAERLAMELSRPVWPTHVCRGKDSNTQPSACGENAIIHCAIAPILLDFFLSVYNDLCVRRM